MIRAIVGLALAAALAPLILVIVSVGKYLLDIPSYQLDLATAGWVYSFTLPAAIALGLPAHFAARRRGITSLRSYVIGGVVIGALVACSFFVFFPLGFRVLWVFLWSTGIGGLSAAAFWLIIVRQQRRTTA